MRPIIDAHHHLWDLNACHYPWLMAHGVERFFGDPTPIQKDYRVRDFRNDAAGLDLRGSVHIQVGVAPGDEIRETEWLETCRREHGLPSAIVAACELQKPDAAERLSAQISVASVRGIRQIIGRADSEDAITGSGALPNDAVWQEHFGLLSDFGLSFDLQLTPPQIPKIAEVLARSPQVRVALCHCGSPWDQTRSGLQSWRSGLKLLASLPNVHCKVSGLGMFDPDWTVESIRPIVESCIDIFGPQRTMFGSNFPVDKLYTRYERIWRAYIDIVKPLSAEDRDALFFASARSFYRLDG